MTDTNGRRVSDHVMSTLALTMAKAKRGEIEAVAIISVGQDGRPRVEFGGAGELAPSINLGLDIMKATFMSQIIEAPGATQMNSGIVIPGAH